MYHSAGLYKLAPCGDFSDFKPGSTACEPDRALASSPGTDLPHRGWFFVERGFNNFL